MSSSPHPHVWDLFKLDGRKFLVIGGARDLGYDMSEALAQAGADGVITSRDAGSAQASAEKIARSTGRRIVGMGLDATSEDAVMQGVEQVIKTLGHIDILINNVGGGGAGAVKSAPDLEHRTLEAWEYLQKINLVAPFLACKHILPHMRARKAGSIINIASIAGIVGRDRSVYQIGMGAQPIDYAAVKAGVIGFTRDLAAYAGNDNIRVNVISPGGFQRQQPQAFIDAYSKKCILGRMGREGVDLKGAVVYLASDASGYVTGHNLVVDGGFSVWQ